MAGMGRSALADRQHHRLPGSSRRWLGQVGSRCSVVQMSFVLFLEHRRSTGVANRLLHSSSRSLTEQAASQARPRTPSAKLPTSAMLYLILHYDLRSSANVQLTCFASCCGDGCSGRRPGWPQGRLVGLGRCRVYPMPSDLRQSIPACR